MPPKAAGRLFNDEAKTQILSEMEVSKFNGNACMRCGELEHGHINECDVKQMKQLWSKGDGKFVKLDRMLAEDYYQTELKRLVEEGIYTPVSKAQTASTIQTGAENPTQSEVQTVEPPTGEDTTSSTTPSDAPATPAKKRTPIKTENVGKVEYKEETLQAQGILDGIPKDGLPNVKTELVGPPTSRGELNVITNYVQVRKVPAQLYTYALTFWRPSLDALKPEARVELHKRLELKLVFSAMQEADALGLKKNQKAWATDYRSLWCESAMQGPNQEDTEWDTPGFDCQLLDGRTYQGVYATVKQGELLSNIEKVLREEHISNSNDYIRALNAHVAQCVRRYNKESSESITQLGANKFYLDRGFKQMFNYKNEDLGLRAVRGYYMSIRPGALGSLLNVNVATTAFLPPVRVSDLLKLLSRRSVEKMLRGKRVKLTYRRQDFQENKDAGFSINDELPRTKVFQQFGINASEQKFFTVLGKSKSTSGHISPGDNGTSVLKYFQEMKAQMPGKNSQDLLCVNVGKRVKSLGNKDLTKSMRQQSLDGAQWIPACLLQIVPYQPMTGQMSSEHTTEMLKHAVHLPAENASLIDQEGLRILGLKAQVGAGSKEQLTNLGFQLDSKLIRLAAKKLPLPRLVYEHQKAEGTTRHEPVIDEARASWNLNNAAFTKPGTLNAVHVMPMDEWFRRDQSSTELEIMKDFISQLNAHHVRAVAGRAEEEDYCTERNVEDYLKAWFRNWCKSNDCTVILLQKKDFDIYAKIKRTADFSGYHTICAVGSKITDRPLRGINTFRQQHFSNMALKVNLKLGGDNHWLNDDDLNKVLGGKELRQTTIIFGSDVTHPGHGAKIGTPSIACVVSTVDANFMSYRGSMRLQAGGQEQIDEANLRSMIKEQLNTWKSYNDGKLPTRILFYRDGVSESQFAAVEGTEIPQIAEAYKEAGGDSNKLSVCFLVVGKRHHTRFYAADKNATYEAKEKIRGGSKGKPQERWYLNGNVKAGLVVDSVVTAPKPTNFFLQSHCAIKGTARSAHYYVLQNNTNISEEDLQKLTMMLCYTFGRSTTGVSYATPAYVADRLCDRGRSYIRLWADDELAEPVFSYKKPKGADGNERKLTDSEILEQKKEMVNEFLRSGLWGKYQDGSTEPERLNPWHPNLDQGMFWM
ncbi:hypothetical protein ACET3X_002182 [Alternaria dauci]|uniref:Piwi domain-containing protein n=1 Tax=Alternaria dauci TaxID=48095 RepID=A0ABR3UPA9_9PLEO